MINFKHTFNGSSYHCTEEKNVDLRGFAESCFIFLLCTCVNKQGSYLLLFKKYGIFSNVCKYDLSLYLYFLANYNYI